MNDFSEYMENITIGNLRNPVFHLKVQHAKYVPHAWAVRIVFDTPLIDQKVAVDYSLSGTRGPSDAPSYIDDHAPECYERYGSEIDRIQLIPWIVSSLNVDKEGLGQ